MRDLLAVLLGALLLLALLPAAADANRLVFEAENYTWIKPSMAIASGNQEASGGKYAYIPLRPNRGQSELPPADDGNVTFKVYIPSDGTWYLWARTFWYDDCGNSFFVFVNNMEQENPPVLTDSILQRWHWVRGRAYRLTRGYHLIRFQNRECGACLDQFLLTTIPPDQWMPSGTLRETPQYLWKPTE